MWGVGEEAQWLRALAVLQRTGVQFSEPTAGRLWHMCGCVHTRAHTHTHKIIKRNLMCTIHLSIAFCHFLGWSVHSHFSILWFSLSLAYFSPFSYIFLTISSCLMVSMTVKRHLDYGHSYKVKLL